MGNEVTIDFVPTADVRILKYYMDHCENCPIPYHLQDDNCIGRNRTSPAPTPPYHALLLIFFSILRLL